MTSITVKWTFGGYKIYVFILSGAPLYIRTFGGLAFQIQGNYHSFRSGKNMCELIAYLIHQDNRPNFSESIMENIWPSNSSKKSSSALNTLIWRANKRLDEIPMQSRLRIRRQNEQVFLDLSSKISGTDFSELGNIVPMIETKFLTNQLLLSDDMISLCNILENYSGEFLPELQSDWVIIEREKYRSYFIRGCQIVTDFYSANNLYEQAIYYTNKILRINPFRESTRRQLIWLYYMNGQRKEATQHYDQTIEFLNDELSVDPMPETKALSELLKCDEKTDSLPNLAFQNISRTAQSSRLKVLRELMLLTE